MCLNKSIAIQLCLSIKKKIVLTLYILYDPSKIFIESPLSVRYQIQYQYQIKLEMPNTMSELDEDPIYTTHCITAGAPWDVEQYQRKSEAKELSRDGPVASEKLQ